LRIIDKEKTKNQNKISSADEFSGGTFFIGKIWKFLFVYDIIPMTFEEVTL